MEHILWVAVNWLRYKVKCRLSGEKGMCDFLRESYLKHLLYLDLIIYF